MDSPLCDDMLKIEILSRTSLKTLHAMRCVSKEFEKLTYEPYLLDLYKQRNDDIVSGFISEKSYGWSKYIYEFAPSHGSKNIDLRFLPYDAQILASSEQGIIVFQIPKPKPYGFVTYHVCKPATKQTVAIPNPRTKFMTEKVAIVVVSSNPMQYKILRVSCCKEVLKRGGEFYTSYRCELFTSKTWAWKLLDPLMLPFCVSLDKLQLPITTRGSIYMLTTNPEILKFDAYSEKWTTCSSPVPTHHESYTFWRLMKHEGRLGFACKSPNGCEVWALGTGESWEKIYVITEKDRGVYNPGKLSFDDPSKSLLISIPTMLFYKDNFIDMTTANVYSKMFIYKSDFEPVNLTGRLE